MPNVSSAAIAKEIKGAVAATVMPLLKGGISDLEADGFVTRLAEITAECIVTGDDQLIAEARENMPVLIQTYKLRAGATAGLAIAGGIGLLVRAGRAVLIAAATTAAGPLGGAVVAGMTTPTPTELQPTDFI